MENLSGLVSGSGYKCTYRNRYHKPKMQVFHFALITSLSALSSIIASVSGLLKMNLNKAVPALLWFQEKGKRVCKIFTRSPTQFIPQMNFFSDFEKSDFFQILPAQPKLNN
ncbi:MAG: hypothetical protein IM638_00090 [Bacteroidetes bacterium]|nr:hypothetical protein [Bacteroidota bacterium]